jgi:hypothetical protein
VPYLAAYRDACTDEERAAFEEFPQYGGVRQQPSKDLETGSCALVLAHVEGSPEEVGAYYTEKLRSHGWELEKPHVETATMSGGPSEGARFEMTTLTAHRNGFWYDVIYETTEFYEPPRPGTHVAVHVWEG